MSIDQTSTGLLSARFWLAAVERAVKTAAQVAVVTLGAEAVDLLAVDWTAVLSMSAGGALVSLLTSIASGRIGDDTPSLV
jgi:hypothetical protein